MQVSVEKVNNVERRLTIVVPAEQVEDAYSKKIDRLAKSATIKGFRPGKAPLDVIQKRFGADARREVLNDIIQKTLLEALTEQNLRPISTPVVEPKSILPEQPLEYIASFEVLPDMQEVKLTIDQVEKLNVTITPEDVDRVIEQLRKQLTQWKTVDRAAKHQDRVVIDYYAIYEGVTDEKNKVQNFPIELGSNVMLPGFEEGLLETKAGDERTLNLTFPDDFQVKDRAGKKIDFVVKVKEVFEANTPPIDNEFVQKLGIASGEIDELKAQIKQSIEQERDRLVKEKLKEQVFEKLLEQNSLDVPQSLVENEAKNIHDEIYPQHKNQPQHQHSDKELAAFNDIARKRVALGLLIAEYAKQNDLKPDNERVNKRIQEIASSYEDQQQVINYLSSREQKTGIEAQVMEEQVLDKLIDGVPIVEKTISYAELKGINI